MGRSLFDVGVTVDEISGSSLEASVAGLGQKAGTLTDLGSLELLYIRHVQNIKITTFYGSSHLHAAFLYFPEQGALEKIPHFCRTITSFSKHLSKIYLKQVSSLLFQELVYAMVLRVFGELER